VQEGRNTNTIKQRNFDQQISEETKKLNNSRNLLAADNGASKRGRVFKEQNFNIIPPEIKPATAPEKQQHCLEIKLKGSTAKGVIYYEGHKLQERPPVDKVHTRPMDDLNRHRDEHCNMFLRRKTKFD